MKLFNSNKLNKERLYGLLWVLAIMVNLKAVFTDFGPDQTYAIATSYRHLFGDRLFQEMWEPHQTSSFLSDIGLWLYKLWIPSLEGAALFLQIYGVILFGLVALIFFRVMKKYVTKDIAHFMSLFFFVSRPKLMVYPEFSNMHIGFSILLFLAFVEFLHHQDKLWYLIAMAGCMCFLVLSYPSCLITYLGVVGCLYFMTEKPWKNIGIFTGICAVVGGIYAGYFIWQIGLSSFLWNLQHIFTSDASHTATVFSAVVFFRGTMYGLIWFGLVAGLSLLISKWKKGSFLQIFVILLMATDVVLIYVAESFHVDWTTVFFLLHGVLMALGATQIRRLSQMERSMWIISMVLSICSAVAVLLLTNQEFLSVFAYMMLGAMVSFIPVSKLEKQVEDSKPCVSGILLWVCLFVMLHRLIAVYGYLNVDGKYTITDIENIVRVGPTKGIVTTLEECNQARDGIEDWKRFAPNTKVLMVEESWYDPIVYLYQQSEISAYSTIDTPVYDESLERYWEKYSEKWPQVVAVKAWNGVEDRAPTGWIQDFLDKYYVTDESFTGTYWQFYVEKNALE